MKKRYFRILLAVSLVFLAAALYRADYLAVPEIVSVRAVTASLLLLFTGFVLMCVCFRALLAAYGFPTPFSSIVAGTGLSIFSKYVPGKIWMVIGPAVYVHERFGYPLKRLSFVSVAGQLLTLWSGMLLGIAGMLWSGRFGWSGVAVLGAWIILSVPFAVPGAHAAMERVLSLLLRRTVSLPAVGLRQLVRLLPWYLAFWGSWTAAFVMLARGLLPAGIGPAAGLAFPLACTAGIAAVVMPGGIGVREGVLTAFLAWTGVSLADAVTVSVASRLWFVLGEAFIFAAGVICHRTGERSI